MSTKYNKSENEYGRIMSIWLYAMIFFGLILTVGLISLYRAHITNNKAHCIYLADMIKEDVSYLNFTSLEKYFQTEGNSLLSTALSELGLVHWYIQANTEVLAEEIKHEHKLFDNILENHQTCPVENIRTNFNSENSLTITSKLQLAQAQVIWILLSSILITGLPLLIYARISKQRLFEKNRVLEFFTQVAQRQHRSLAEATTNAEDINTMLDNEAQPIIHFIDKTRAMNDQIDPEYINRLEQNFIDLEERNAYLAIQNKELNSQTTLKSSFFANLSHDFRTPLYTIEGYSKLLMGTELERKQLSHINAIQTANANLLELVSNFLSLSRLEAGKIDIDYSDLDLRNLLNDIITGLSFLTTEHKNHFCIDVSEQLPNFIETDAIKLRQIIANIISNAVKYTHNGLIYTRVTCRHLGENTIAVNLSVTDTGKGISSQDLETIFDPYTRLESDKTRIHGTGLGLGICKELCEVIGAKLSVESEYGKGSSFNIDFTTKISQHQETEKNYLFRPLGHVLHVFNGIHVLDKFLDEWLRPIDVSIEKHPWNTLTQSEIINAISPDDKILILLDYLDLDNIESWAPDLKSAGNNVIVCAPVDILTTAQMYLLDPFILVSNSISNQVLSECITFKESIKTNISEKFKKEPLKDYILLLAEDNDLNRKIIEERLISFGALVISCPDGDAALELYKARTYDAILMDAHMPKISGTKLTEIIRRDFSDSKTPIIGITASTSTVEYQHFIHSGMSDCLIKPLQDKRLIETILKYAAPESIVSLHDVNKITTAQSSSKDLQLSTQDRIDAMSIDSIKAHILELQQVMKISLPKEKQIALFNELHKMNGTLSMTSFKDLQVKTSEIESLVNPMLLEQDEKTESLLIRQIVLAEEKLLELIPELELKIA